MYATIDSHVDLLYDLLSHHPDTPFDETQDAWISLPKLAAGGVRIIVSVLYCTDAFNGPARAADNLRHLLSYAGQNIRKLEPITTVNELDTCYRGSGAPGALLLLENADALAEFPAEALKKQGVRMVGLTHVGKNRIADGNTVPNPEGLTRMGRKLVEELDRLGFAIDTAHLSDPCFKDVAELFPGRLISSHTGFRTHCDTPRNLSDEQIRIILSRGGVIGVAAYPGMLSPDGRADLSLLFRQIDWFVQKFGPGGIGLGTDFGGYDTVCEGFEDHARLPALAALLADAGYPDSAIRDIMGDNWFRFFRDLLQD
ncbi:MAG: membrane dipeptidase [Geobacteraceae bacterium]|nr:membrane dipeptidase [Geobacteraceae bacterium]